MEFVSRKVDGPAVTSKTRREALTELYDHPAFPKNARVEDIEEVDGKWIATLGIPKQADFPFSDDGGDDSGKPPKEKSKNDFEGPDGDNDSEPKDESDDSDDSDSEDKDKGDKKGDKAEISQLKAVVDAIANALGIPIPGADGDSPVPGDDTLDAPDGPGGPPPGLGGPPPPGAGGPPSPHEHPLKPGEAPPGSTPVGAPAFSKVQNPFPEHIGKQKAFEISDITDRPLGECINEIKSMVEPFGYYVHQAKTQHNENGQRRVAALLADHPPKVK